MRGINTITRPPPRHIREAIQAKVTFTATKDELEVTIAGLAVNDTIDYLNVRKSLLANNQILAGDSANPGRRRLALQYGKTEYLPDFAKQQEQVMIVERRNPFYSGLQALSVSPRLGRTGNRYSNQF